MYPPKRGSLNTHTRTRAHTQTQTHRHRHRHTDTHVWHHREETLACRAPRGAAAPRVHCSRFGGSGDDDEVHGNCVPRAAACGGSFIRNEFHIQLKSVGLHQILIGCSFGMGRWHSYELRKCYKLLCQRWGNGSFSATTAS